MNRGSRNIGTALAGGVMSYFALIALHGYDSIVLDLCAILVIALVVSFGFDVFDPKSEEVR
jgi:hypothetical protein